MNGSDCVTVLGARWLSPASDPKMLAHVECWPGMHLAHLATSQGLALEEWWGAGTASLLVIQGLDDIAALPATATRCASNSGNVCGLSTCLKRDTFCCWNSRKR
jgi:hypothetical protein